MNGFRFITGVSLIWLLFEIAACSFICFLKEGKVGEPHCGVNAEQNFGTDCNNFEDIGLLDFLGIGTSGKETSENNNDKESPKVKKGKEYKVYLPEEKLVGGSVEIEGKPFVFVMNVGLLDLRPKEAFSWYLSLILDYELPDGDDMPGKEDVIKMEDFIDNLSERLAEDPEHPNALALGRATGDGTTHAMWYVNDPEKANAYLQNLISSGNYPFHFEFMMEQDKKWKEANYWLKPLQKGMK